MKYSGKIDAKELVDGVGAHSGFHSHVEAIHAAQAPSDAIFVPDAQLLFHGDFKRSGVDLVISAADQELVLHDYFKGEHRAPLASPDGAHLTGDLVNALAGHVEYAQADGNASAHQVIGHVTKLAGTATAIRNGVSIILNNGDNVEKGDVVLSGSNSTVGITFIDGTVFGLSSNARMVLNEMVYDPNGSNNSSLLSLVAGTITFVAGETAKHGDMKVDTPVATMGIRGTAVLVEIDFTVPGQGTPDARFQVLVEPDGTTGSYILFDKTTLTPLAVVDHAGLQINISNGIMSQTLSPLSPELQQLINDVFSLKFTDSSNTKSLQNFTDTITPQALAPIKLASGDIATPLVLLTTTPTNSSPSPFVPPPTFVPIPHIDQAPTVVVSGNATLTAHSGTSQSTGVDSVSGTIRFADINAGDLPTASANFVSLKLLDAQHNDITATLTSQQIAAIAAQLVVTPSPGNNNNGLATWTYNAADTAFNFLTAGETLTLTYDAVVNNNYPALDQVTTVPFTITINATGSVEWIHPTGGLWSVGSNWSSGAVPTATEDAIIPAQDIPGGSGLYDVTILTPAVARNLTLNADDTTGAQVTNESTLTIGEVLTIFNNGVLDNTKSGTVNVGQKIELLDQSSLQNSGLITLGQGGDFGDSSSVTNSGTIEIAGGTLNVQVDITNSGGVINVDDGASLTLSGATIDGGAINDGTAAGTSSTVFGSIDVTGASTISNASLNKGVVTVASGVTLTLDDDTVSGTTFTDTASGATIQIDDGTVLTLMGGATINGGTINDGTARDTQESVFGSIDVIGPSAISNAIFNNGGVTIASGITLTLDNDTVNGTTFNDASGATIQIDDGTVLTLTGATINGGAINDGTASGTGEPAVFGDIAVTGPSTISNAFLNNGGVTIANGVALTLSNDTVTGTTFTDVDGGTAQVEGGDTSAKSHSAVIDSSVGTIDISGAVTFQSDVVVNGGAMSIAKGATLDVENPVTGVGATLNDVYVLNSGTIQVDTAGPGTTIISLVLDGGTTVAGGTLLIHAGFPVAGIEGAVEIETGGATFDDVTVANNNKLMIDSSVTLTIDNGTTINGGTIVDNGEILVTASSEIENATVDGGGDITVTTGTLTLATVTIDDVTLSGSVTNSGTLTIDGAVTLNDATITGGALSNSGTLNSTGSSFITNASLTNTGTLESTGGALTIDPAIAGPSINNSGTLEANGGALNITSDPVTNTGTLQAIDDSVLTLTTLTVTNTGGTVSDAVGSTIDLAGATISGGTLNLSGALNSTGTSFITGTTIINSDHIDIVSGTLTIDPAPFTNTGTFEVQGSAVLSGEVVTNSVTIGNTTTNGTIQIDHNGTLTLENTTINGGTIADNGTLLLEGSSKLENVTFTGSASIDISGHTTLDIGGSVSSGVTVNFEVANGHSGLILDNPSDFHGVVKGLVEASPECAENYIDLKGFADNIHTHVTSAVFNSATDVTAVTITNGGANNLTINLSGDYRSTDIEFATDHNGGTLFSDPAANSGAVTVDSGTTLDIASASTAMITFANGAGNTGELVLGNSNAFAGQIAGFTGDGTISNSDLIDLADVNIASVAMSKTSYTENGNGTGTLSLYDANGHVLDNITFDGSYKLASFAIENDGSGHTLIVDPPASSGANANSSVVVNNAGPAANSVVIHDPGPSGNFAFNFTDAGHPAATDFHRLSEGPQSGSSIFANVEALFATYDGGHGNTLVALNDHDSISFSDVHKPLLHVGDFHVV